MFPFNEFDLTKSESWCNKDINLYRKCITQSQVLSQITKVLKLQIKLSNLQIAELQSQICILKLINC